MSWQDLPIYSRNDGSFIISYNNAPYHVAKTGGGFTEQYPALVTWEEVSAFVSENPDKVTPEVPVTVTPATPPSARTVNNVSPNSAGNVTLNIPQGTVTSINGVYPNSSGLVALYASQLTGLGQIVVVVPSITGSGLLQTVTCNAPAGGSGLCRHYVVVDRVQTNNDYRNVYAWDWTIVAGGSSLGWENDSDAAILAQRMVCIRVA